MTVYTRRVVPAKKKKNMLKRVWYFPDALQTTREYRNKKYSKRLYTRGIRIKYTLKSNLSPYERIVDSFGDRTSPYLQRKKNILLTLDCFEKHVLGVEHINPSLYTIGCAL